MGHATAPDGARGATVQPEARAGSAHVLWWFIAVAAAGVIVAVVWVGTSQTLAGQRLQARSLLSEWSDCRQGRPPAQQLGLIERYREITTAQRPVRRPPAPPDVPLVRPAQPKLAPTVWPSQASSARPVVVAVIDSGVNAAHPRLDDVDVLPGVDLVNPCGNGHQDVSGHGTAVAGVVAASSRGAEPPVQILPVRSSLTTGQHNRWLAAAGVVWAARNGADVINLSFATTTGRPSMVERLAVRYAARQGAVLVAAAGNDPARPAGYPAAYPEVVSVASVDGFGRLSTFSARTGAIDVAAVGSRMVTLSAQGTERQASGTSLAAPVVSAAVAQLLSADRNLEGSEAVAAVLQTTHDWDPRPRRDEMPSVPAGGGLLNYTAALIHVCRAAPGCELPELPPWVGSPRVPSLADFAEDHYPDAAMRAAANASR